jgi:mono/diheme cytochrome c family protein
VTEIPEHLLKRSRERRSAMGGEAGGEPAEGSATPAPVAETAVARPAPAERAPAPRVEAPRPVPAYVAAAQNRRKIPLWVSPVLALLPIWLFVYVNAMTKQPKRVQGPLAVGATAFRSNCSACHAGDGSGGVGYPLYNGEAIKSFPNIADQIRFIYNGNRAYAGKTYTPADREGGAHVGGVKGQPGTMPAWGGASGQLTDAEILAVVCEERYGLASAEVETAHQAEFDTWCSADAPNWVTVEEGGFTGLKLDVSATVSIPSPPAPAAAAEASG